MKISNIIVKNIKGFGLIEVLLSTVILGVGLVGVAQFQGNVFKDGSLSKQRAEALKLAEKKLEEVRHFSTISEYETNITNLLSGIQAIGNTPEQLVKNTTTFTLKAYAEPDASGRSANLSVEVTWPDLTNNGTVTSDTTVQLSTVVSNTTPASLAMTSIAPAPLPSSNPDIPDVDITIDDPADPTDLTDSNPDACYCKEKTVTTTVVVAGLAPSLLGNDGFVNVGGGMGGGTTTTTTVDTTFTTPSGITDDCVGCCLDAGGDWASLDYSETQVASFQESLDQYFEREAANFYKTKTVEDQTIDQHQFNPAFLRKGYQSGNDFYKYLLQKTGGGMGGMGGGGSTTVTTETFKYYSLCSFITEVVTTDSSTTTNRRTCKMWGHW